MIDSAREIRDGDALEIAALSSWLAEHAPGLDGELEVRQFPAGHSNLTYLLRLEDREYVLRRPPRGAHVDSGHDMSREWRVLEALETRYPHTPTPIVYCDDPEVIGAPFYVMERVEGVILRDRDPDREDLTPSTMASLSETFVRELVDIHGIDWREAGLESFGHPEGYIDRQIEGWRQRYQQSNTDDIQEMHEAGRWLAQHRPEGTTPSLIHNDFKYDNLILSPHDLTDIRAVLDWEMATIGEPLMDLGTSLAYWIEPDDPDMLCQLDFGPTSLEGNDTRRELIDRYAELSDRDVSNMLFYYVYGLYKVAVIGQQIYYRFQQGDTDDPRFASLIQAVRAMAITATRAIDRDRIGA